MPAMEEEILGYEDSGAERLAMGGVAAMALSGKAIRLEEFTKSKVRS
jgi:hypothetical protein